MNQKEGQKTQSKSCTKIKKSFFLMVGKEGFMVNNHQSTEESNSPNI